MKFNKIVQCKSCRQLRDGSDLDHDQICSKCRKIKEQEEIKNVRNGKKEKA